MRADSLSIDIIIPTWNGRKMLEQCLISLKHQSHTGFGVIVVDNGSTDGTLEMLREKFPEIKIVEFSFNTGFSVAINAGIQASSADWVLLLNNDMEVDSSCIETLTLAADDFSEYDFFALKMLCYHNRKSIDGAGDAVLRGGVGYRIGTLEDDSEIYSVNRETFGACAGAGMYSKTFFKKVGLFDPDFFAYLEDVDLNMRARRKGLKCMFLADAKVYHIGSATSGSKINPLTVRLSTRNNLAVIMKNYPFTVLLQFLPAIIIYQGMWLAFCIKKKVFLAYMAGLVEAAKMFGRNFKKRQIAQHESIKSSVPVRRFAQMVKDSEHDAVQSIMARRQALGKNNVLLVVYCKIFL